MKRKFLSVLIIACISMWALMLGGCPDSTTETQVLTQQQDTLNDNGIPKATPIVNSTSPFNGQLNVLPNAPISVTFNTNINPSTVNTTNFQVVRASDNAPVAGVFSFNGTTVTFTPNAPLDVNTQYQVTLSRNLRSSTNGTMAKDLVFFFFTNVNPTALQLSSHHVADNKDLTWGGVSFAYEDISATGTDSGVTGDDHTGSIPIGFTFNFYGTDYTTAFVGTNGYLTFGSGDTTFSNYQFPSADGLPRIAAWFDDLYVDGPAKIVYEVRGTAPNRRLIVQWYQVRHFGVAAGASRGDFEIILYEGTNQITMQYQNTHIDGSVDGSSATVGINKGDGIDDSLYSFNTPYLSAGRIVTFFPASLYGLTGPTTPLDGATGVARNQILFAFFNKPLLPSSLTGGTFALAQTGTGIPISSVDVTTGAGNSIIAKLPQVTLNPLTNYTATISTALADIYGVHLATPVSWAFTTGP